MTFRDTCHRDQFHNEPHAGAGPDCRQVTPPQQHSAPTLTYATNTLKPCHRSPTSPAPPQSPSHRPPPSTTPSPSSLASLFLQQPNQTSASIPPSSLHTPNHAIPYLTILSVQPFLDILPFAQVGMSATANAVYHISTQPPEIQIPLMSGIRTALILEINPSEKVVGLPDLPTNLATFLNTINPYIPSNQSLCPPPSTQRATTGFSVDNRPKVGYVIHRNPPMSLPYCLP
jgi:hypothetical protein